MASWLMLGDNLAGLLFLQTQGVHYFVRVSAYNVKGWGPPQCSTPASAAPSSECAELHNFDACGF